MKKLLIFLGCTIGVAAIAVVALTLSGINIFDFNFGNNADNTPHEHSFGAWAVVEEATCTENGSKERACACGEKETDTIEAAGHNYTFVVTDPTCDDDGYTTHTCGTCGHSYVDNVTTATGHNYTFVVTDPTCDDDGYTTHTCGICGHSYVDEPTTSTGHNYSSVVTDPTCTTDGFTTNTCNVCGDSYTNNITEANGHGKTNPVVTKPTCTEYGFTTYTCDVCGESYEDDKTDPVHLYTQWTITESGDTTDTYMKSCDCGQNTAIVSSAPKASEGLAMEYSEELGGYVVIGRGTCADAHIVIPACYKGPYDENPLPVVAIGEGAFANDMDLESITLIGNVRSIGAQAFVMTMLCHTLVLSDSVREIGEQAFTLMGINLGGTAIYYTGTEKQLQELEITGHFEFNGVVYITSIEHNYVFGE